MPDIRIVQPIENEHAKELKALCPLGVFDIEDLGKNKTRAIVSNQDKCTTCRECVRHEKFASRIDLGKKKDVFEFHVESLGIYKPEQLVIESLSKLKEKATHWLEVLKQEELMMNN